MNHPLVIVEILAGIALLAWVEFDIFQSIIVPRITSRRFRVAPFLVGRMLWPNFRNLVERLPSPWQYPLFEVFAPVSFIVILVTWLLLIILGYALILFALGHLIRPPFVDFSDACYFAGTSVLTLGFGDIIASHWASRAVVISAALIGLIFMALEVSYLFALQTHLQQREQVVNTLISRAGAPASGVVLLLRYKELGIVPSMSASFLHWELWIANILESHRAYPLLIYFRSSSRKNSWVSTVGAMLDAAILLSTSIEDVSIGEAELFYWIATSTLKSLRVYLGFAPHDGEHLSFAEYREALEYLQSAGYKVKDAEKSWPLFLKLRSSYMSNLIPIAKEFDLPVNNWIPSLGTIVEQNADGVL